jgi:hypothetical protein
MRIFKNRELTLSSNGTLQKGFDTVDAGFTVQEATAVLQGMDIQFANRNDHPLGRLRVHLSTELGGGVGNLVTVAALFALRDWSGGNDDLDGDDPIQGTIYYSIIVV